MLALVREPHASMVFPKRNPGPLSFATGGAGACVSGGAHPDALSKNNTVARNWNPGVSPQNSRGRANFAHGLSSAIAHPEYTEDIRNRKAPDQEGPNSGAYAPSWVSGGLKRCASVYYATMVME